MTIYSSDPAYGIIGDGIANDFTGLQAFLNDLGNRGGDGILAPGKYFVSGGDLALNLATGIPSCRLLAYGARILTDPTQARTALTVTRSAPVSHLDGPRKVIVEGLNIDHFENTTALCAIKVNGCTDAIIRDVTITAGANTSANQNNGNYQAISIDQTNPYDGNTGAFSVTVERTAIAGGAIKVPAGIVAYGQDNALSIIGCNLSYIGNATLLYADSYGNIANGVRILDSDFEDCDQCIMFASYVSGHTACAGLMAAYNRVEACGTFFYYRLDTNPSGSYPVIGPNMIMSTTPIYNPHGLTVVNY